MSDARSLLSEMRVTQAEHLPLVAAFLGRMGVGAVVNAAAPRRWPSTSAAWSS